MAKVKVSKGQADVLKRLAMGDTIIMDSGRYVYASVIPAATVRALRDKGLINNPGYGAEYRITDDGRALVEQQEET